MKDIHILLVEDNPVNQIVAIKQLEKLGYATVVANNGREAVDILSKRDVDLVLMDVQMPEMDGLEATVIIRDPSSAVLNHEVPIIALTAHAMKGDKEKCIESGMNAYLSKPVKMEKLKETIHGFLINGT